MPYPDDPDEEAFDRHVGKVVDAALALMLGACVAGLVWWAWASIAAIGH